MNLDTPEARRLQTLVAGLGIDHGLERSIKVIPGGIWTNRFLLSLSIAALGASPVQRLTPILQALMMPARFYVIFLQELEYASFIHLGYEETAGGSIYKLYLEFPQGFEESGAGQPGSKGRHGWLVHKAFKWSATHPGHCTIARYRGAPGLSYEAIMERLQAAYGANRGSVAAAFALNLLSLVRGRMDAREIFLLEVTEEHNSRCSFDMNLYDAELTLGDITLLLRPCWEYFGIPEGLVHDEITPLAREELGHLSGGIDRRGREFFTIYFGVRSA